MRNFGQNLLTKEFGTSNPETGLAGGAWYSGNRGATNGDGWSHILISYNRDDAISNDAGRRPNAIRMWWNGQELTSYFMIDNRAVFNPTFNFNTLGSSVHNIGGGNANVDIDEFAFYGNPIGGYHAEDVPDILWNGGTIARAGSLYSPINRINVSFSAGGTDVTGDDPITYSNRGGQIIAY